jgi:hypothetical protein
MPREQTVKLYKFDELKDYAKEHAVEVWKQSILREIKKLETYRDTLVQKLLGCKNSDGSYDLEKISQYASRYKFGKEVNRDIEDDASQFLKDIVSEGITIPPKPFETRVEESYNKRIVGQRGLITEMGININVKNCNNEYFINGVEYYEITDNRLKEVEHCAGLTHARFFDYIEKLPE